MAVAGVLSSLAVQSACLPEDRQVRSSCENLIKGCIFGYALVGVEAISILTGQGGVGLVAGLSASVFLTLYTVATSIRAAQGQPIPTLSGWFS